MHKLNEEAFAEFDEHRNSSAKMRRGWSELAKKKARNLLTKHSSEVQQEMVDYSIIGGYTGLYAPRMPAPEQRTAAHKPLKLDLRTSDTDKARAKADLSRMEKLIAERGMPDFICRRK